MELIDKVKNSKKSNAHVLKKAAGNCEARIKSLRDKKKYEELLKTAEREHVDKVKTSPNNNALVLKKAAGHCESRIKDCFERREEEGLGCPYGQLRNKNQSGLWHTRPYQAKAAGNCEARIKALRDEKKYEEILKTVEMEHIEKVKNSKKSNALVLKKAFGNCEAQIKALRDEKKTLDKLKEILEKAMPAMGQGGKLPHKY